MMPPLRHAILPIAIASAYYGVGYGDMGDVAWRWGFGGLVMAGTWLGLVRAAGNAAGGHHIPCRLVRVVDGDTLVVDHFGRQTTLRLYRIDAPEKDQPYGAEARDYLFRVASATQLTFIDMRQDTYRRDVVKLYANGEDVQLLMLKAGLAWVDPRYNTPHQYTAAFAEAQRNRVGLWVQRNPIHPSQHRHRNDAELQKAQRNADIQELLNKAGQDGH